MSSTSCWFEQAWIPAGAEHLDAAKQFVAYLYSDEACKLFAESGAIQPVLGIADSLEGDNKMFYSIYDNGAKAAMGNFASFTAIPGVEVRTVFFDPVNSLVSGSMTEQQWIDGIKSASDQMRANINNVEDLISRTGEDMMKVRNMGRKSLEEVQNKLAMMGLSLASDDSANSNN